MRTILSFFSVGSLTILALLLASAHLAGCDVAPAQNRLDLSPNDAPYQLDITRQLTRPSQHDYSLSLIQGDIDGDGVQEYVEALGSKLLGHDQEDDGGIKVRWEKHLPAGFTFNDREPGFGLSHDFNGDRVDEIYLPIRSQDFSRWRLVALDPATGQFSLDVPLPTGEDRRPPEYWDGNYHAEGVLEDADGQGNPALILVRRAGYDATGRGIVAVSPFSGKIIWSHVSGAQPAGKGVVVEDLDRDGRREIAWISSSPDNLGGRLINGTTDNIIYLTVMDNRGEVLHRQELGGKFCIGEVESADVAGDQDLELIYTVLNRNAGGNNQIVVWNWSERKPLAVVRRSQAIRGLAIFPGSDEETHHIVTGSDNGTISRYSFSQGTLVLDRQLIQDIATVDLLASGDFLPPPGDEIVFGIGPEGHLAVLDEGLNTLAVFPGQEKGSKSGAFAWHRTPEQTSLVTHSVSGSWVLDPTRNNDPLLATLARVGAALLLAGALAGMFVWGRKRGRQESVLPEDENNLDRQKDRQVLFQLYRDLADVNHQVVGKAKGLDRLIWLLEAYASQIESAGGSDQDLKLRIEQVLGDFQELVHPMLVSILRNSAAAHFEEESVLATEEVLKKLAGDIDVLSAAQLDPVLVAQSRHDLRRQWTLIQEGFYHLRQTLNDYFTTDPVRMIQGMLLVRTEEFKRARITARLAGAGESSPTFLTRIDQGDLRFVLDNLLDNALRAMTGTAGGQVQVQLSREGQEISLQVSDTGQGIAPDLQDAVFSNRYSSRQGGGHGLYRSREILDRWGGEIILADSRPGKGTTFIVKLLAAEGIPEERSKQARG